MAVRIVGVDLPQNKRGEIALTYIYGIGRSAANSILGKAGVDRNIKVQDWTDDQAAAVREVIQTEYKVEGHLRSEIQLNIKRLWTSVATEASVTVSGFLFAVRAPRTMHALARVARKQLLTRRKLLNNIKVWQKRQSQLRRGMSKLTPTVSSMCIALSTTLSFALPTAKARLSPGALQARWLQRQ